MKFQIPNIHHSKVNRRTHVHTDRQAESNMPFQLFQSWGHNKNFHINNKFSNSNRRGYINNSKLLKFAEDVVL